MVRWLRDGWVSTAALFLLAASFTCFFQWGQMRVDATAYWKAGTQLRTGQALYSQTPVPPLEKAYIYPPAFAAAFAPLTALPPLWGYAVWMAFEVVFALALARQGALLAGLALGQREARRTALALALAAGVVPVFDNLAEGQVNLLVALLCVVALLEAERDRNVRAGFALAAAVHIKLLPIVLIGAFLLWRRTRLVCWTAVALLVVGLLPLVWRVATMGAGAGTGTFANDYVGFWNAILWPAASTAEVAGAAQLFAPNFSLRGTLARLFVEGTALSPFPQLAQRRGSLLLAAPRPFVDAASTAVALLGIATALWSCRRCAADPIRRVAAAGSLLVAGALAGPTFWQHHFVILGVAGAGLWPVLAAKAPHTRRLAWTCALAPLVATVTVPFAIALLFGGFESAPYRALREYGLPTGAVLIFLATALAVTARR
jgi:alpha-1,2-mannosyltransferase